LSQTGTAMFETEPAGTAVVVDGTAVGTTPLTTPLSAGHHIVDFARRNLTRRLEIDVQKGQSTVTRFDWAAKPTGRLQVHSTPSGARVSVDGRPHGVTPLTIGDLTEGPHTVTIDSDQGSLHKTVTIEENQTAEMSEAIFPGWVRIVAPIEMQVSDEKGTVRLDEKNQGMLSPGKHVLRLENRALGFHETRTVEIEPGAITSVPLDIPRSKMTVTASQPSEVFVDDQRVGQTPLSDFPIVIGTHEVRLKSSLGERLVTTTVTMEPAAVSVDFSKP